VSESADERHRAAQLTALARVLVVCLILVGERIRYGGIPPSLDFDLVLVAAGLYALAAFAAALLNWSRLRPGMLIATLDLVFLGALTYTSPGQLSAVRSAFFLVPVLAAFTQTPRSTALLALATPVVFATAAVAEGSGDGVVWTSAAFLLLVGGVSVAIAKLLAQRAQRIQGLADEARALTVRAVEADEGERRRLSYAIHDEPIQQLLAARLQLGRAVRGDAESARSAEEAFGNALQTLRELTLELHPHSLDQLGLAATLEELAEVIAERSGVEMTLEIDERHVAGRGALCFAIVRELLRNAGEHANASKVSVAIRAEPGILRILVSDDGKGIPAGRVAEALREGHIGLATVFERARAAGGRAEVKASADRGTTVEVTLPAGA
jgi:two-component system, NarL family, sensor kinase